MDIKDNNTELGFHVRNQEADAGVDRNNVADGNTGIMNEFSLRTATPVWPTDEEYIHDSNKDSGSIARMLQLWPK